jgi:hypothetical protein
MGPEAFSSIIEPCRPSPLPHAGKVETAIAATALHPNIA